MSSSLFSNKNSKYEIKSSDFTILSFNLLRISFFLFFCFDNLVLIFFAKIFVNIQNTTLFLKKWEIFIILLCCKVFE